MSINWFNHTSWMVVATSTDRPKSDRNPYVIEFVGGVMMLSLKKNLLA